MHTCAQAHCTLTMQQTMDSCEHYKMPLFIISTHRQAPPPPNRERERDRGERGGERERGQEHIILHTYNAHRRHGIVSYTHMQQLQQQLQWHTADHLYCHLTHIQIKQVAVNAGDRWFNNHCLIMLMTLPPLSNSYQHTVLAQCKFMQKRNWGCKN